MRLTMLLLIALMAQTGPDKLTDYDGDWARMKPNTPRGYVCHRTDEPITIDGRAEEGAWRKAPWTEYFRDIEGDLKPDPLFKTRAKLLWDDEYLYVYAELEEPHVWATLTKKNSRIFDDNDFEVFIDPDGDNHHYYEFEMNALNTIWELMLMKPYKDGGPVVNPRNLEGTKTAVHVRGTINDPSDFDEGWSVEIAIPLKGLKEYAQGVACPPKDGDYWRLGFSRVEWQVMIEDGRYKKIPGTKEYNWIWSPQGIIDMHRPERWGFIQFTARPPGEEVPFVMDPTLAARDLLMGVYHRQRAYRQKFGQWAKSLDALGMEGDTPESVVGPVRIEVHNGGYTASATIRMPDGGTRKIHTRQDSKIWFGG